MERKGNLRDFSKNIIFRFDYLFYIGNKGENFKIILNSQP